MAASGRVVILLCAIGIWHAVGPWPVAAEDQSNPFITDGLVRDTQDALETTKQYGLRQKGAFEKRVQTELRELQTKIAELQKPTDVASSEVRKDMQKAIQDLEKKKDEARRKFDEVNESISSAWTTSKEGMTAAVEDLKKRYKEAMSKLP